MNDESLKKIADAILQAGGGGAILVFVGRLLLSDYLKKGKELRKLEREAVEKAQKALTNAIAEVKNEVSHLKERIYHTEKLWVDGITRLNLQSDRFSTLSKAFEGFVKTTEQRFRESEAALKTVDAKSDQVIRVGKEMAARIRGRTGTGENK